MTRRPIREKVALALRYAAVHPTDAEPEPHRCGRNASHHLDDGERPCDRQERRPRPIRAGEVPDDPPFRPPLGPPGSPPLHPLCPATDAREPRARPLRFIAPTPVAGSVVTSTTVSVRLDAE